MSCGYPEKGFLAHNLLYFLSIFEHMFVHKSNINMATAICLAENGVCTTFLSRANFKAQTMSCRYPEKGFLSHNLFFKHFRAYVSSQVEYEHGHCDSFELKMESF